MGRHRLLARAPGGVCGAAAAITCPEMRKRGGPKQACLYTCLLAVLTFDISF